MKLGIAVFSVLLLCACEPAAYAVAISCTVSATPLAFGAYDPLSTIGNSAVSSWAVVCNAIGNGSGTVSGTLKLSTGSSGRYTTRTMKSGTNALQYNIYLTPTYTEIIGDGTAGTYAPTDSGTVTSGQVYNVTGNFYGYIPPLQNVPASTYTDTIIVTVTF